MQFTEEVKTLENHISDAGLIPRIKKESLKLDRKNQSTQFINGQRTCIDMSLTQYWRKKKKFY